MRILVLFFSLSVSLFSTSLADTTLVDAAEDTEIRESDASNYSSSTVGYWGHASSEDRYMIWELTSADVIAALPVSQSISEVRLSFRVDNTIGAGAITPLVYRVLPAMVMNEISWNIYSLGNGWPGSSGAGTIGTDISAAYYAEDSVGYGSVLSAVTFAPTIIPTDANGTDSIWLVIHPALVDSLYDGELSEIFIMAKFTTSGTNHFRVRTFNRGGTWIPTFHIIHSSVVVADTVNTYRIITPIIIDEHDS